MMRFSKFTVATGSDEVTGGGGWSKWQIALIVSAPVAFGVGYYLLKRKDIAATNSSKKNNNSRTKGSKQNNHSVPKNTIANSSAKANDAIQPVLTPVMKAENIKNEGNDYFKSQKFTEAIKRYSEAIQLCPDDEATTLATIYQNRAAAYEQLGNNEEVINDCNESLRQNRRYLKAVVRRARAFENSGNLQMALEDLATAAILVNFHDAAIMELIESVSKKSGIESGDAYMKSNKPVLPSKKFIETYMSTFRHGTAIDQLDPVNNHQHNQFMKTYKKTVKYIESSNVDKVESLCDEMLRFGEQIQNMTMQMEAVLLRGTYLTLSKQYDKAIVDLTTVINNEQADPRVRINALLKRSTVYQHMGDQEKCLADFKIAESIDENNSDIYHHQGQIYLVMNQLSDAVDNFRKCCALDPDASLPAVQHCFAEYKYASEQNDSQATDYYLQQFDNIMMKYPETLECKTLYGQIILATSQKTVHLLNSDELQLPNGVLRCCQNYLHEYGLYMFLNSALFSSNRKQVLVERGEFKEADVVFERAIKQDPNFSALYVHKGLLTLQWKGDIEQSMKFIKQALEIDENCEFAYETLATIEMQTGNHRAAVAYFDEAIKRYSSKEELYHLFAVRNIAFAQCKALERLGLYQGNGPDHMLTSRT